MGATKEGDIKELVELTFNYPMDKMLKGKHIKIFYFNDNSHRCQAD